MADRTVDRLPLSDAGDALPIARLVPPAVPPGLVQRPQLAARLDAAMAGRMTLVSAGPGWGKTLLVASWARSASSGSRRVAWLALDVDDNDPVRFWNGVIAALRMSGAVPAGHLLTRLTITPAAAAHGALRFRRGVAALVERVVLVLDDFHVIDNVEILESLDALLRHDTAMHLVVLSRRDPLLSLHRLRVGGALQEIRAADLAFDGAETDEFLHRNGQRLTEPDVSRLLDRTEGWPAGLRLAAMYLSRNATASRVEDFAGDDRAVSDYLLAEVLASQPAPVREFLLRTSITERICAELADVLVEGGSGQRNLEELEQSNTFITSLGPHRQWFRYHPLLREVLEHRLRTDRPELARSLHRRAARWFTEHGAGIVGLQHAAAARDWPLVGELSVTDALPGTLSPDRDTLHEVLARIPDAELSATAALQVCLAARLLHDGRFAELPPVLARARTLLVAESFGSGAATAAAIDLFGVTVARGITGDMPRLLEICSDTLDTLTQMPVSFAAADHYRAIALSNQGVGLVWTGQPAAASAALHPALDYVSAAEMELTQMNCLGHLGLAALFMGRLEEAEAWADQGVLLAEERGWTLLAQASSIYLTSGLLLLLRGRATEGEKLLRRAAAACQEPVARVAIAVAHILIEATLGRPDAALRSVRRAQDLLDTRRFPEFVIRWLGVAAADAALSAADPAAVIARYREVDGSSTTPAGRPWPEETVRVALARLALGDASGAARELEAVPPAGLNPVVSVELWLARALVADRVNDERSALLSLREAVELAFPQRLVRPFQAFDHRRTRALLRRLTAQEPPRGWLLAALEELAPTGAGHREPVPLLEPLTNRELTVLQLLPSMQSNKEIAADMMVSVNTVKAHLKTLYRKLDVPNRRTAVRRGSALGLISEHYQPSTVTGR